MKFTIRKYKKEGWQIWNTEYDPFSGDIIGESNYFIVALFKYWINLILNKQDW